MEICKKNSSLVACFPKAELLKMYETHKKSSILAKLNEQGKTLGDFNSMTEALNWVHRLGQMSANDRDEHELIAAVFFVVDFYEGTSEICFKLKNSFNYNKDKTDSIDTLNKYRDDPPDFIIKQSDGWRDFELKRYREALDTDTIFDFIIKKVGHYGNLGDMNLLLILQANGSNELKIDFRDLHERLTKEKYAFRGEILLSFNNNSAEMVICQVFPNFAKSIKTFILPSLKRI
ncbi:hypothetical protein A3C89_01915 [Candidatus Kaiserbacteria bacterium RIFCSPHIGHO2_02_FULL_50_50]|uniref:Restriction endonuclease n=1 Tax=Candidatus Kaiserbacteria bacterium RIFCSPHIGHO2_02_FULL_50_50 TaxID=1798492 RepID=A0A1F6DCH0_9BACT|nr:MAG: hypothetical protein A3C89_01915 [Candidatus Kaiserbacteria bacterium RIFCSPHIGHO2_02_FULL_50_50]OGG89027.1 MAG: hypothetical protein A3G62_04315 [Candidatus Kaiserbacteria bacterium RIFCSPLOWO2_12_FULL_50_10]